MNTVQPLQVPDSLATTSRLDQRYTVARLSFLGVFKIQRWHTGVGQCGRGNGKSLRYICWYYLASYRGRGIPPTRNATTTSRNIDWKIAQLIVNDPKMGVRPPSTIQCRKPRWKVYIRDRRRRSVGLGLKWVMITVVMTIAFSETSPEKAKSEHDNSR